MSIRYFKEREKNMGWLNFSNPLNTIRDLGRKITEDIMPREISVEELSSLSLEIEGKKQDFQKKCNMITIVNAGRVNNGKSSLLNSLIDKEEFAVKDIRETLVQKKVEILENVFVIDTPGLDAADDDDMEAYDAYKDANAILFVHAFKDAEIQKTEVEHLKNLSNLLTKDYLEKHFILVFTYADEYPDQSEREAIIKKAQKSIQAEIGIKRYKVFEVSNQRYQNGNNIDDEEEKKIWHKESGIPALRDYILNNIPKWIDENIEVQGKRFDRFKKEILYGLEIAQKNTEENVRKNKALYEKATKVISIKLNNMKNELSASFEELGMLEDDVRELQAELKRLQNQHEREAY